MIIQDTMYSTLRYKTSQKLNVVVLAKLQAHWQVVACSLGKAVSNVAVFPPGALGCGQNICRLQHLNLDVCTFSQTES